MRSKGIIWLNNNIQKTPVVVGATRESPIDPNPIDPNPIDPKHRQNGNTGNQKEPNLMIKIERNEPCPCESGKKYKKCCLTDSAKNHEIERAAQKAKTREEFITLLHEEIILFILRVTLISKMAVPLKKEVRRDIAIPSNMDLYRLHLAIQKAFNWDNDHMFSFYLSDKIRDKQSEYLANPLGEYVSTGFKDQSKPAYGAELRDLGLSLGQKFKYLFDYGVELIHIVEVIDIQNIKADERYPKIIGSHGKAPEQYDF
jgi:uncharacterized protein YchJ